MIHFSNNDTYVWPRKNSCCRLLFSSRLNNKSVQTIQEKEEITKTPRGLRPLPTKQATRACPFCKGARSTSHQHLSTSSYLNQTFPLHPTWPGTTFIYLHQQLIHHPSSHQGHGGTTHSSPKPGLKEHTWGMVASVCGLWPQCGQLETTHAATLKSGSSRTLLQFLNLPG